MSEKLVSLMDIDGARVLAELMRDVPEVTETMIRDRLGASVYKKLYPTDDSLRLSATERDEIIRASASASQAAYEEHYGPIIDIGGGTTVDVYATRNAIAECRRLRMSDSEVATIVGEDVFTWLIESKLVAKSEK